MRKIVFVLVVAVSAFLNLSFNDDDIGKDENLLFFIELSENKNIIVYDINYNADKTVNEEAPVNTYWIRYSERGQKQGLTYFQSHWVYGLEPEINNKERKDFVLKFVSYKKKKLYLQKNSENKYCMYMDINGKISLLNKIRIEVGAKQFGLPTVKWVDLYGKELTTGKPTSERIIP